MTKAKLPQSNRESDVIVIGAGVSGLMVAARIARSGVRFFILKAREAVGGRISSVKSSGRPDRSGLGAEFEPLDSSLCFAGEATADEFGTVHGALASGERVAGEVLAALKSHRRTECSVRSIRK